MARNPMLDAEGYIGEVPTGRSSFNREAPPDTRPADLAEEIEVTPDASAEVQGDALDEFAVGGGWYEIDGEKYHGKAAAQDALDARA
jgi:hypothetical protein